VTAAADRRVVPAVRGPRAADEEKGAVMSDRRWVVTSDGERGLAEIAADLTVQGFTTDQVLDQIGVVIGAAPDDALDRLRGVPGVADVAPETQVDIGPPDAPITW